MLLVLISNKCNLSSGTNNDSNNVVKYDKMNKIIVTRKAVKKYLLLRLSDSIDEYTHITKLNVTRALNKYCGFFAPEMSA